MKAGGRDLQDPLGGFLPMDIGEINGDFLLPLSEEGLQIHMAGRQQAVPFSHSGTSPNIAIINDFLKIQVFWL